MKYIEYLESVNKKMIVKEKGLKIISLKDDI